MIQAMELFKLIQEAEAVENSKSEDYILSNPNS